MSKHRHNFRMCSWRGDNICFRCSSCKEETERKMTKVELRYFETNSEFMRVKKPGDNIHRVYHDFCKRFCTGTNKEEWKYVGFDLMERVERWMKKWPGEVRTAGCDDDCFASSDLILIEHRSRNYYMGTTVVYIPQCSGENPIRFFLYPGHRIGLIKALQEIAGESVSYEKRQKEQERKNSAFWAKARP